MGITRASIYDPVREGFRAYLRSKFETNRADAIIREVDDQLAGFLREIDPQLFTLYAITTQDELKELRHKISLNPILKHELGSQSDVDYSDVLVYYRNYLNSPFYPGHNPNAKPLRVNGEGPDSPEFEPSEADITQQEGLIRELDTHITRHERNPRLRALCIEHFRGKHGGKVVCECCGFDFSEMYGMIGEGYIEVHHLRPIHTTEGEHDVDPTTDLVPLCSNCHSMIHRNPANPDGAVFTLQELKGKLVTRGVTNPRARRATDFVAGGVESAANETPGTDNSIK